MKKYILLVDDDEDILELLEYNLKNIGYEVLSFSNTKHIRQVLSEENIDLIIMDRNLPEIEGSLYIEMLRSKNIMTPVIFLSAKDSKKDIKDGFLRGADDYITKPFDMEELLLRVNAVLNRYINVSKDSKEHLKYKDMTLDLNLNKVIIFAKEIALTKLEVALLKIFILNKGKVLDRNYLREYIWNNSENIHQKTVNVAVKRLKEKIDPTKKKDYIKTIRGVGYLLS